MRAAHGSSHAKTAYDHRFVIMGIFRRLELTLTGTRAIVYLLDRTWSPVPFGD
jgi:hypothetical protein